jgi:hypothetical protein
MDRRSLLRGSMVFALSAACLLVWPAAVTAQGATEELLVGVARFQYAVKFLCVASIPGTSAEVPAVVPGEYRTKVNIHNPHRQSVQCSKKISVAFDGAGPVSDFIVETLGPDQTI